MDATTKVAEMERLFGKRPSVEASLAIAAAPVRWVCPAPVEPGRCCAAAVRVLCVCRASWSCPTHGERCTGSHD